jgi:hypothetical protein
MYNGSNVKSACLANERPRVQPPVLATTKQKEQQQQKQEKTRVCPSYVCFLVVATVSCFTK